MKDRFGERNCMLMDALKALDPEDSAFLDVSKIKPLLDLTNSPVVDMEYTVARQFLEIDAMRTFSADVRVEAIGLLRTISERCFRFIAEMVHRILSYMEPPNAMLQQEDMDLFTVCGEMKDRFGERNCMLMDALKALDPEDSAFLDVSKIKPLLDLTNSPVVDMEYTVARQFLGSQPNSLKSDPSGAIPIAVAGWGWDAKSQHKAERRYRHVCYCGIGKR
ncbi:unnamed protein product [Merluccius merluccius]